MVIALIASDKKKELMTELCMAYCGILSRHTLCATSITGKYISDATGLPIEKMLPGASGGIQQIASRVAFNEVDILFYFRDTSSNAEYSDRDETNMNIMRLCDLHNVLVATNIATAEALVLALDRGDLDWRKNIKRKI
ncbi:MAG: methylglyoxal synthase [Eubacteriales bacterium]|nr:methylglyoxal synthase [Eubacteriales bacterium]